MINFKITWSDCIFELKTSQKALSFDFEKWELRAKQN